MPKHNTTNAGIGTEAENALSVTPDGTQCSTDMETDADNAGLDSSKCSVSVSGKTQVRADKGEAEKKRKQKKKAKKRKKKWKQLIEKFDDLASYSSDPREGMIQAVSPLMPMIYNPVSEREGHHITRNMLLGYRVDSGFHFGFTPNRSTLGYVGKRQDEDGHIAVFGGSGSGKSYGIAKPTIDTWKAPIFATDPKGEFLAKVKKGYRERPTLEINLIDGSGPCMYEPFQIIRQNENKDLVSSIEDVVNVIISIPANTTEPFWRQSARRVLSGALIYFYNNGLTFIDAMIALGTNGLDETIKLIKSSTDMIAKFFVNDNTLTAPNMYAGISAELHNHIKVFITNPIVQKAFSDSETNRKVGIIWDALDKCDIFVTIDQRMLGQLGSVVALITTQLIRHLQKRPEMHSPEGQEMQPVLLLLDEFPQLGKLDVITEALSILRSKKVTISLFCQSLAQLDFLYGENTRRIICDNCAYKIILNAADLETQKYFSGLVGTKNTVSKSINASFCPATRTVSSIGLKVGESSRPVIVPHEFAALNETVLLHPGGFSFICNAAYELSKYKDSHEKILLPHREDIDDDN